MKLLEGLWLQNFIINKFWISYGSDNASRFPLIHLIARQLTLLAIHAFIACDTTWAFNEDRDKVGMERVECFSCTQQCLPSFIDFLTESK
ncbi:hypothetical protein PoB_006397700 [Plakobranchus ocellatus]|uniref:Uncharacterized protein n=1 Tax=Plakobranchus ocellatus TaxID=259542 RepID=A0AAV4CZW1_9GAST|nr:hypothetical protein PoB_006397700 [Plakobranchus ocellatus]